MKREEYDVIVYVPILTYTNRIQSMLSNKTSACDGAHNTLSANESSLTAYGMGWRRRNISPFIDLARQLYTREEG